MSDGGFQLTWWCKNVTCLTEGSNWPFRCLDVHNWKEPWKEQNTKINITRSTWPICSCWASSPSSWRPSAPACFWLGRTGTSWPPWKLVNVESFCAQNFLFSFTSLLKRYGCLQMQMQNYNKYQNNQNLSLPSGSDILLIYWSCRASCSTTENPPGSLLQKNSVWMGYPKVICLPVPA